MRNAYFDCFSGISGNMVIGAFLDAGMPLEVLKEALNKLHFDDDYELILKRVNKLGISASYFNVHLPHHHEHNHDHKGHYHHHEHRNLHDITKIIDNSTLDEPVKKLSLKIFNRLGQAEAKVHNCSVEEIHFHEVGAVDAIIDIVGSALGINYFGINKVYSSPLHVGKGMVKCAHGLMPIPAPATAELLRNAKIYSADVEKELATPTGAAIITTLTDEFLPLPAFTPETISYGAGTWDLPIPNVLRLFLGKCEHKAWERDTATIIETTIDDMNPEFYGYVMDKLFRAGAADVYMTPIYMKKNRPGILLTVVCTTTDYKPLLDIIFSQTTTLGVRIQYAERQKLLRAVEKIETPYGPISLKIGKEGDVIKNIAPEWEECRKIAQESGIPVKKIFMSALINGTQKLMDEN